MKLPEVASGSSSHPHGQCCSLAAVGLGRKRKARSPQKLQTSPFYAGLARPPRGAVGAGRVWSSGLPGNCGVLCSHLESQTLFMFSFEGARDQGSHRILMLLLPSLEAGCWLRSQHPTSGGPKPGRGEGSVQSHHSPHWGGAGR